MILKNFIPNKTALVTLIAACLVVIISLGIRQTFGLFYFDFETDLNITMTQFGFAIGLQLFLWGLFGPWFGIITDKYGGNIAVFIGDSYSNRGIEQKDGWKLGLASRVLDGLNVLNVLSKLSH